MNTPDPPHDEPGEHVPEPEPDEDEGEDDEEKEAATLYASENFGIGSA